jgi:hypothetical protein
MARPPVCGLGVLVRMETRYSAPFLGGSSAAGSAAAIGRGVKCEPSTGACRGSVLMMILNLALNPRPTGRCNRPLALVPPLER